MKKQSLNSLSDLDQLVYATDPNILPQDQKPDLEAEPFSDVRQNLKITLDRKHRGGKSVTLVYGFVGSEGDLERLGKALKAKCGCGGAIKNGEILIQGDHIAKIIEYLTAQGHKIRKVGG